MTIVPTENNGYGQVQQYQPVANHPVPAQFVPAATGFSQWIHDARELAPIAESLARTSFVPKPFQGKPAEVVAAILAGQEIGFGPMASLRLIDVIEGKPGLAAIALRALVQSHGHDIWTVESTATRAVVKGRRKGSEHVETSSWSLDRAKQMELTGKANWKKQPTAMLLARATSEVARLVAADVIAGMPYSSEELADGFDGEAESGTDAAPEPAGPAKRTVKRKPLERAESTEPPLPPAQATIERVDTEPAEPISAPPVDEPAVDGPDMPEQRALAAMFATFNEVDLKEKSDQLDFIAETIGRRIESRKELTAAEVATITAALRLLKTPDGGES
jgi:hypothetical protein